MHIGLLLSTYNKPMRELGNRHAAIHNNQDSVIAWEKKYADIIRFIKDGAWIDIRDVRDSAIAIPTDTFILAKEVWTNESGEAKKARVEIKYAPAALKSNAQKFFSEIHTTVAQRGYMQFLQSLGITLSDGPNEACVMRVYASITDMPGGRSKGLSEI
jgi:hypothetical protein